MPSFNLDAWWNKNVDPNMSVLDNMYKEITREAVAEALKSYGIDQVKEEQLEKDSIDVDDIDLSDVIGK